MKTTNDNGAVGAKRQFFTEQDVAVRWSCSVQFVRKLRYDGTGPLITFLGTAVRYKLHDLIQFERANRHRSSSERDVSIKLKKV